MRSERQKSELKKYYDTPVNRRLKYVAIAFMAVAIIIMLCLILWLDDISVRLMLIMRGTVGLFALIFVILVAVLEYRVWRAYIMEK